LASGVRDVQRVLPDTTASETDRPARPERPTGETMQMDVWYDAILQELVESDYEPRPLMLLEDPEPSADPENLLHDGRR
jgi:hypothetical protein